MFYVQFVYCQLWISVLQDESKNIQFTVLTDRSLGGGSIQDGNLELMVGPEKGMTGKNSRFYFQ